MKNLVKFATLTLIAAALVASPLSTRAQEATTNAPAAGAMKKKGASLPFHGKIATLDATAGTFTVGELSFSITSKTKITNGDKPATLADAKVGENVAGSYKKADDGKLTVTSLKLGVTPKKKKAAATPAPAAQ